MKLHPAFDPYANDVYFLHAGFIFEGVGVTAYRGAVEPLTALVELLTVLVELPVLSAAAAVLAVEVYHAGAIFALLHELSRRQAHAVWQRGGRGGGPSRTIATPPMGPRTLTRSSLMPAHAPTSCPQTTTHSCSSTPSSR
jgi:hypothetical protein